jgi:hypothetical protein
MTYETLREVNNTTKSKNAHNKLNLSVNMHNPAVPGSVKHSSKQSSTAASSIMKNQINQAMQSLKMKNSNLKSNARVKAIQKPGLQNFVNSTVVKNSSTGYKQPSSKRKSALNSSSIQNSYAKNSSIYTSRRSKGISDLNKSVESNKKYISKFDHSQASSRKNDSNVIANIISQKSNDSQILELKPGYNPTNDDNFGLDDKYLESSLDRQDPNHGPSHQFWGQEQHAEFENVTSESMTSLGSVPDEYTIVDNVKGETIRKEMIKQPTPKASINIVSQQPQPQFVSKAKTDFVDEEYDTEIGNENTQSTGVEIKYSLNVPSMISHLKRKDNYLESLDSFLNENLKAIADLVKIKKQVKTDMGNIVTEHLKEKSEMQAAEKKTKVLERDIARTLEENYCIRFQNDESIKVIQRIREKTAEKYQQWTQELEGLYEYKEQIKERVDNEIKADGNVAMKSYEIGTVLKVEESDHISNKLTSDEYKIDCLKKIVDNEQSRVNQRLDIVREKSKILSKLIKDEDFEDASTENSVIRRGIWNLLNN